MLSDLYQLTARHLAALSGGGFDVVKAEIPEPVEGFGQCDSVTGGLLSRDQLSSADGDNEATPSVLAQSSVRSVQTTQQQTMQIGGIDAIPPSPPPSPSLSALSVAVTTERIPHPTLSSPWTARSLELSTYKPDLQRTFGQITQVLPMTPDATPSSQFDSREHHRNTNCCGDLKAYVQSILPGLTSIDTYVQGSQLQCRYMVEDAVMESVDIQWSGVVLTDTHDIVYHSAPELRTPLHSSHVPHTCGSLDSSSSRNSTNLQMWETNKSRRTLLTKVDVRQNAGPNMRMRLLCILDHATEVLRVDKILFAVDRTSMGAEQFRSIVHGLCYVGASIIGRSSASQDTSSRSDRYRSLEDNLTSPRKISPQFVLLSMSM